RRLSMIPLSRVGIGDGSYARRKLLADLVGYCAHDGPDSVVRVLGFQGQIEVHKLLIVFYQFERLSAGADFLSDAVQFVIEFVARALWKMSGRMNCLYFGASFAPRIEQAASQNPGFQRFVIDWNLFSLSDRQSPSNSLS